MNEIFISYSRQNTGFVDKLVQELEKRGLSIWMDREDIRGGTAWRAAISNAIRSCDAFIIVLSQQSAASKNVTKELALADTHNKVIIPIRYQACEIPPKIEYQLAGLQIVDFAGQSFTSALDQLINALPASLTSPTRTPTPQAAQTPEPARVRIPAAPPVRKKRTKWWVLIGIVGLLAVGACLCTIAFQSLLPSGPDISGVYNVQGVSMDCFEYIGQATVSKSGSGYLVEVTTWLMDGRIRGVSTGTGTLHGSAFDVAWQTSGGGTRYNVQSGGTLSVIGTQGTSSCQAWEAWTPQY